MRRALGRPRTIAWRRLALRGGAAAAVLAGCVGPAPFIPVDTDDGTASGPDPTGPDAAPRAEDDALCLQPALGSAPTLELAAPGVLANDLPATGLRVEPGPLETVLGGTVVLEDDGGLRYTAPAGAWGTDAFAYTVIDEQGRRAEATARVDVRPTTAALERVATGEHGLLLEGELAGDRAGTRVAALGDVSGDGIPDLGVAAHLASHAGAYAGRSYVVFGRPEPGAIELAEVSLGPHGYALDGETTRDVAGWSLAGVGDVDGDGRGDVLVGAPWVDTAQCPGARPFEEGCAQGRAYVAYGQAEAVSRSLAEVSGGTAGFALDGTIAHALAGSSIAGVRDLDGDGRAEILVGSPWRGEDSFGTDRGSAHLVRGAALIGTRSLATVGSGNVTRGFVMTGLGQPGQSVAAVGDVDGDGLEDLAIADHDALEGTGVVHVVFGKASDAAVDLDALEATEAGFTIVGASVGDRIGTGLAGVGDFNGDGLGDLAIGAPGPNTWDWPTGALARSGQVYVVFGKSDSAPVLLVNVERGAGGLVLAGEPESAAGHAVAGVGDFNGDGQPDVLVGAPAASFTGVQAGRVYVVFGGVTGPRVELGAVATGLGGLALDGPRPYEQLGYSVADVGDLDGDGRSELLLGAPGHGADTLNHALGLGRAYVLPGIALPTSGAACAALGG